jgi:hypothetical protein
MRMKHQHAMSSHAASRGSGSPRGASASARVWTVAATLCLSSLGCSAHTPRPAEEGPPGVQTAALESVAVRAMRSTRADTLIDAWIHAAGGARLWDAVRDVQYTMTTVWYDPTTGEEQRRRPRYIRIRKHEGGFRVHVERTEAEGRYVQVWDGQTGWATLNGALLADTARAVREIEAVAGDVSYWIGLPWKLRDPGVRLQYLRTDSNAAGEVVEVSFGDGVGLHPGDRYWYYFGDPRSAFPTEVHFLQENNPPALRERTRWSDWRRSGPATYLGQRLHVDGEGRPLKALLISDVVANGNMRDALFRRPR